MRTESLSPAEKVPAPPVPPRANWSQAEAAAIHALPLPELMFRAQNLHRRYFDPCAVETASLLSIKTGGCPEDCGYCSQSAHHQTGVKATRLMEVAQVVEAARQAKAGGATRFCMGAAWRSPKQRDLDRVCAMIESVRALGMETCVTLGMLTSAQVARLAAAGLDYYNHNVDTSRAFYPQIITTRSLDDRLETLAYVRAGGIRLCCGGIVGMGETTEDRVAMLVMLANLSSPPESVPLNMWNEIKGTPVQERAQAVDPIDFVRLVALARILMPKSIVRLSAGRHAMSDELQALCLLAGANSIFTGDVLLTTGNPGRAKDAELLDRLGLRIVRNAAERQCPDSL